ncbi:hypothetical protein [Anaerotignum sp.]
MSIELLDKSNYEYENVKMDVSVYDKYFTISSS